jgi:hypothetical protein
MLMTAQPTEQTVFHAVLARLAAVGIHCETESAADGKLKDEIYAAYHFADGSHFTWGAHSITGAENSATHPISAHGRLDGFYTDDAGDEPRAFTTGDFATDATELVAWIAILADQHGRAQK